MRCDHAGSFVDDLVGADGLPNWCEAYGGIYGKGHANDVSKLFARHALLGFSPQAIKETLGFARFLLGSCIRCRYPM